MKRFRRLLILVALALAAGAAAIYEGWIRIPPNAVPWAKVMLDERPGWFANIQLNGLSTDGGACRAALGRSTMKFSVMADRQIGADCGFTDVVRADSTPIAMSPRPVATCAMTAGLYWWQRRLDEIAQAELNSRVVRIDQLGTYACRNINSAAEGRRSQHATANAIDIAAFHLADGRVISVQKDYGQPTPEGRFLDAAHDEACSLFNIVLGPKYNRLHANHFHLDLGGFRFCR
ncbi:extensin-like domain-containing protein [Dongia sp. agr-C8]